MPKCPLSGGMLRKEGLMTTKKDLCGRQMCRRGLFCYVILIGYAQLASTAAGLKTRIGSAYLMQMQSVAISISCFSASMAACSSLRLKASKRRSWLIRESLLLMDVS